MTTGVTAAARALWVRAGCMVAVIVVMGFVVRRVLVDFPGPGVTVTRSSEDVAYAAHRMLAYAHIAPGVVYLVGGAAQLSARIRRGHYTLHRRLGRVVLPCGLGTNATLACRCRRPPPDRTAFIVHGRAMHPARRVKPINHARRS